MKLPACVESVVTDTDGIINQVDFIFPLANYLTDVVNNYRKAHEIANDLIGVGGWNLTGDAFRHGRKTYVMARN
jgi:hypothetical protein